MTVKRIGILHPGEMGISVAVAAQNSGHEVYWTAEGRSAKTTERAEKFGLRTLPTLGELCTHCEIVISVCPPHAAEALADEVIACGFGGLYLDANAIAPQRAIVLAEKLSTAGVAFVDGGIIGGPAWKAGTTWLYLSGAQAPQLVACFAAGPLETSVIGEQPGKASALKMCYAAYTKGTTALLSAILATAEQLGVRQELYQQWGSENENFVGQTEQRVRQVTAKAWRFTGEMEEIAATFAGAGLPGGFHLAAAEIYQRMAKFKDATATPLLDELLSALSQK